MSDEEREDYSWAEVADRQHLCPSSPGWGQPHIPDDDGTCRECGQAVDPISQYVATMEAHPETHAFHRDGAPCVRATTLHDCPENHRYGRTFEEAH